MYCSVPFTADKGKQISIAVASGTIKIYCSTREDGGCSRVHLFTSDNIKDGG